MENDNYFISIKGIITGIFSIVTCLENCNWSIIPHKFRMRKRYLGVIDISR